MKSDEELAEMTLPFAVEAGLFGKSGKEADEEERKLFVAAMPLVKERAVYLKEFPEKLGYLFADPPVPPAEEFFPKKLGLAETVELLKKGRDLVEPMASKNDEEAEGFIKAWAEKENVKLGDIMMPLRVAVTGARVSPPLFGSLRLLGAERSLARVDKAIAALKDR
jgi:glutamyl-tRNA synthetase